MTTLTPVPGPVQGLRPPTQVAAQCRAVIAELSRTFFERDAIVGALVMAMLAGQHSLLLGPPGTAKSELARELTSRITNARYWEILLTPFTAPTQIFGPIDVAELVANGRYTQIFTDRATQAHIAFLDEIFKCSTASLNAMLSLLNERRYHPENGDAPIDCPLISAVTASNELGSGEETAAIYDRLLVRVQVERLKDPANFAALLKSVVPGAAQTPSSAPATVDLADLKAAVELHVPAVRLPDGIVDTVWQVRSTLHSDGVVVSDRRWKAAGRLLQASAFLTGRDHVDDTDLEILTNVLWDTPTQRPTVQKVVLQQVSPGAAEVIELSDAITELEGELASMKDRSDEAKKDWAIGEATKKLGQAHKRLQTLRETAAKAGRSTTTVDQVIAHCDAVNARILKETLGLRLPAGG